MRLYFFLSLAAIGIFSGIDTEPTGLTVREEPGHLVFRWSGDVQPPMLEEFEKAYDKWKSDPRRIVVSLNSNGGNIAHGSKVITHILKMQAVHNVDTTVEKGSRCASMCVPIYLAGARRSAAPKAKFMFHEVSFSPEVDVELRKLQRQVPGFNVRDAKRYLVHAGTDNLFERYLLTAGANPKWVKDMRKAVRGRDIWRTGEELVDQRSGLVHRLD